MGNANAFHQGAQWYDDYQNQARQAKSDAWTQEQQGRMRKGWEAQDSQSAGLADMIENIRNTSSGDTSDPRALLGLGAMEQATPAPSAYAQRQGFEAPVGADVQTPGLAPVAPKNSPYFDAQTKVHQQKLAMAKALGGKEGAMLALDTGDLMRKTKLQEQSVRIADTVQNLRPQEYQKLMETVTADSGNKYEATIDPATGITTLKLGDSKAQLTRAQAAQYFAAKYRLKEGDPTAIADLEKIDSGLAAKVAAEFKSLRDTANDGNKAAYQNAIIDVREKGLVQRERHLSSGGSRADGNGVSREERMRYTSLFNEAGRRMSETEKSLRVLQSNRRFMLEAGKPGTPQAEQLNGLKDSIASYSAKRLTYQGLLANSQSDNPPGLASAKPKGGKPEPQIARPTSAAEHAAIPKGAKYIAPNGQTYVKQ